MSEPPLLPRLSDAALNRICGDVGRLMISWALFEQGLEFCTNLVYHNAGGKHKDRELPRNFSRKVKYLRKRFRDLPVLAPLATEGGRTRRRSGKRRGSG